MKKITAFKLSDRVWYGEIVPSEYRVTGLMDHGQDKHVELLPVSATDYKHCILVKGHQTIYNGWGYEAEFPIFETRDEWIDYQQSRLEAMRPKP